MVMQVTRFHVLKPETDTHHQSPWLPVFVCAGWSPQHGRQPCGRQLCVCQRLAQGCSQGVCRL